jgi:predicted nucleic acid-binding protein
VSYLLDTNVISEIRRGRDESVRAWTKQVHDAKLYLSVLTVGEIRKGIETLRPRDPAQADMFAGWLQGLLAQFSDRVLPIDARVAEQWGRLNAQRTRNTVDSLIAATAHVYVLTLVTRNVSDFAGCDVPLLNPWDPEPT